MSQTPDESALRIWRAAAPYWDKHRAFIDGYLGPVTPVLVDDHSGPMGPSKSLR